MKSRILVQCLTIFLCIGVLPASVLANYQIDTETKSYLTMDDGYLDETGKVWSAIGSPSISSVERMIGEGSLYFDGSSALITVDSPDFSLGSNDFTVDFYLKLEKNENTTILTQSETAAVNASSIYIGANYAGPGSIDVYLSDGTLWDYQFHTANSLVNDGDWHHIAIIRSSNQVLIFVDGQLEGTGALPQNFVIGDSAFPMQIAAQKKPNLNSYENFFKGYLDEFRISPGIARWTTDFTPPSPQPEQSEVGRAILIITMINGMDKEYDLSMEEINSFITWYDGKDVGIGPAKYAFTKTWNKGPFKVRTEYVIFDKILMFEVNEYDSPTP